MKKIFTFGAFVLSLFTFANFHIEENKSNIEVNHSLVLFTEGNTENSKKEIPDKLLPPSVTSLSCPSGWPNGQQLIPYLPITKSITYTQGLGLCPLQIIPSTGVLGLVATIYPRNLKINGGNIPITVTGEPLSSGTAQFTVNIGGKSCSFSITVPPIYTSVNSLNCASAVFSPSAFTPGTAYSGTLTVPYAGGNGGNYLQQQFSQNGLQFTLPAGTLNTGNGNLIYTVSGTPDTSGTIITTISFPGATPCNVSIAPISIQNTVVMPGNPQAWMRHNLGADTSLDPDVPVQGIHGNYYQWGRATVVADASTPSGAITGWDTTFAPEGSWVDGSKTANDPCPSGFRVPTAQQIRNLININNTTTTSVGTFTDSPANFGSAKVFSGGGNNLTFPIAGYRDNSNGTLKIRGANGKYWTSTPTALDTNSLSMNLEFLTENVISQPNSLRTSGFSVRCISE
ncbi:FISUMP domain-containing protein [Chryseobacterium limigenitum]|uniref:Major paralogous domain-containing protein n=1 Tax=Chryseobacterium limigenitum TaxID=1612149 RepID=A0A1K2IXQ4_9FLAO|nr:FISUMP domain-containing protein [Chryseobacterium limigenitum]SFZ97054.1 major paralogous domain-containing protein [Chryseobacterium limigenitum]